MKNKGILTLRDIFNELFSQEVDLSGLEILDYLQRIFPDIYNEEIAESDSKRREFYRPFKNINRPATLNEFLKGNIRENKDSTSYAVVNETKLLLYDLNEKNYIQYKSGYENSKHVTPRESMVCNIKEIIKETDAIKRKEALRRYYKEKNLYNEGMSSAIEKLYESVEEDAFAYLVFLLIAIAIFQSHISELENLYDKKTIDVKIGETVKKELTIKDILKSYTTESLTDKHYQAEYFVYMQRPTYEHIYKKGKLSLKTNSNNEYSYAELTLEDEMFMPHKDGIHPLYKNYKGETILNRRDKLVYSIMTGVNGTIGIMIFRYDAFNYAGMLFRSALFISSYPGKHIPVVQKMLITAKEIQNLDLISGLLKIDSSRINIEKEALDEFIKEHENCKWMKDFKDVLLPFIKSHEKVIYSFAPEELYYNSLSCTSQVNKIEIIELLKSYSMNSSMIECAHLDRTNRLIGELE